MAKKKKKSEEISTEQQVFEFNNSEEHSTEDVIQADESLMAIESEESFQDEIEAVSNDEEMSNLDLAEQIAAELGGDVETEASLFLQEEEVADGFLPEASEEVLKDEEPSAEVHLEGTELDSFDSAEIEELEFVEDERLESIVESILFASDRPVSLASIKLVFKGTNVKTVHIKRALDQLAIEYAGGRRGVTLEEAPGGYQLKTKFDNLEFLKRTLKSRPFRLSGPALEVLAIVAYKQPVVKSEIDEIRGVESGHLLRALMEKGLCNFEGKSDLPGRPMQYGTTKKFLEIFGLRNLKELPTLSQIDELLPEGIDAEQAQEKPTLSTITDSMSETISNSYSQGEDELMKIQEQLEEISVTSDFFEQEKVRQKQKREADRAQNIRDALMMNEEVSNRDKNWLKKYDDALAAGQDMKTFKSEDEVVVVTDGEMVSADGNTVTTEASTTVEASNALENSVDELAFADDESLFEDEAEELPFVADDDEVEGLET